MTRPPQLLIPMHAKVHKGDMVDSSFGPTEDIRGHVRRQGAEQVGQTLLDKTGQQVPGQVDALG